MYVPKIGVGTSVVVDQYSCMLCIFTIGISMIKARNVNISKTFVSVHFSVLEYGEMSAEPPLDTK